jgi:uncharacterized protein (DUF2225 family)
MTMFVEQPVACPACGRRFRVRRLTSTNTFGPLDSDLYRHAGDESPLPLAVAVCPHCEHVDWTASFPEPDSVPDELADDETAGSRRYELLGEALTARHATTEQLAWVYLQGSWCARDEGDPPRERELQRKALLNFERAWSAQEIEGENTVGAAYLIGELNRRLGKFTEAQVWWQLAEQVEPRPEWLPRFLAVVRPMAMGHNAGAAVIPE